MDSGTVPKHDLDEQRPGKPLTPRPTVNILQPSLSIDRSKLGEQRTNERWESDTESGSTDMDNILDGYRQRKALLMTHPNDSIASHPKRRSSQQRPRRKGNLGRDDEDGTMRYASDDSNDTNLTFSTSEDVELSQIHGDELLMDDEETGLTKQDRRKKRRRKMKNAFLDDGVSRSSEVEKGQSLADKSVLRASIINVLLIASWYCFSLSISIVSKPRS